MRKPALSAHQVAGLLVGLFGLAVAARWVFQVDAITRLIPGSEHMGIVSPLLFLSIGLCFFGSVADGGARPVPRRLVVVCITGLVLLPLGYLFEGLTKIPLGIDFVRDGTVPTPDNPYPGRLSANGSLAFLLSGTAFCLAGRPLVGRRRSIFLAVVAGIAVIALAGLAGYFLGLQTLYKVANFNRLLPATAVALLVVSAGLWTMLEQPSVDSEPVARTQRRINRRSVAVITGVALGGGIAGFAVMRDTFEQSVSQNLLLTATTGATSLGHALDVSLWFPRTVATRPTVGQALAKLSKSPDDLAARDLLQKIADSFMTAEITGAEFYDASGRLAVTAGAMARSGASVTHRLNSPGQTAALIWADGYVLVAENEVLSEGRPAGRVVTEQRMPLFDRLLQEVRASNETTDAAICSRDGEIAACAPTRLRSSAFTIPMFDGSGAPTLPIIRALLGERGVTLAKDRRGIEIVSAFTPVKDYGLGFAVKTDLETLYAPQRARVNALVLALLALIALAIFIQRSQIRPVLARLVESKQRLKAILEEQSELVSLAKPDGELTYVNPAYARHFGLTPAEMEGRSLFDHVQAEDREAVQQVIADVLTTGITARSENRMTVADGAERWVAWTNALQRDPSGRPMLHSVGRDVTERKKAELALRTSRALLARMGQVAGVGAWQIDLRTGKHEWTEQTRRIHEVGSDYDPTLETAIAFYAPEARSVIETAVQRGVERGEPWTLELPMVTAKGRHIWVRAQGEAEFEDGAAVRLVGAIQDITERMQAERALRTLTAVFDATTDYVVQLDTQGRFTYMNPAARQRSGVALDAPIGHLTLADFTPPQTFERFIAEIGPTAAAEGVWVGESLVWNAEQREFPVSHIVIAHRDKQGEVEYFSGLMRDISAAKTAEQALRDSEHRLRMVTDNLPVLISYLDRDLRFRFVNKTYDTWFGKEAAPQIGTSVQTLYGEQAWVAIEPRLRAALQGQNVAYEREMPRPDGSRRDVQVTVVPDRDAQGGVVGLYTLIGDVTSYREAQRALQESEARLRTIADALPMRVAYVDADERYRFNNLAYERGFGKPRQEIYGQTVRALLGDVAYKSVEPHIRRALRGEQVIFQSEMISGGSYICYEAHYIPQWAADGGTVLGFHAVVSDITRQKMEERRLIELARVDALTGALNRAGFELRLAEAMERCRTTGALMVLMYLDIDRFKQINDQFGHDMGDALLRAFAGRLSQTLRATDTIARLGGDEFTVIMEGLPRPEVASTVAAKIVQVMNNPFVLDPQTITVSTSIGLAFYQGDATTAEALIKQADVMLYQAKGAGRNNFQVALRLIDGGRA